MPNFKDQSNRLHFLSDEDIENGGADLLPPGCVLITDEAAENLRQPTADQIKQARVAEIDIALLEIDKRRARALSDAILTGDKTHAQALEDQAVPLRVERKTLTT